MTKENIAKVATEAVKLLFDNPNWTYEKAIERAMEVIENEDMAKMEKIS